MIRVCSGWHPAGRKQYGDVFLRSFDKFWPAEVDLEVYTEAPEKMPRGANRSLWHIPGAVDFNARVKDNPDASGRVPKPCWKSSEVRKGYSFRTDAAKFWKQLFIPWQASKDMADGDILVWLDGDVVTTKPVPLSFVTELMDGFDVAYLGRQPSHSEIGFWAITINPTTRAFLLSIVECYLSGAVFDLPETHSAFVWDYCRKSFPMRERNLCRPGARGHVFPSAVVGRYLDHRKGPRKGVAK